MTQYFCPKKKTHAITDNNRDSGKNLLLIRICCEPFCVCRKQLVDMIDHSRLEMQTRQMIPFGFILVAFYPFIHTFH